MGARLDYAKASPGAYKAMLGLETHTAGCGLEPVLTELVKLRVSQMNGCAYCIDMHTKELRAQGETEQRLYLLNAWREAPFYSERETAALAWAEAVTRLPNGEVPEAVYEQVRKRFTESELVDLTLAIIAINGWNRLSIGFRVPAGSYVAKSAKH